MDDLMRLDTALVKSGLYTGRAQACEAIRAGKVTVDGVVITKASFLLCGQCVQAEKQHYVSRGALKLSAALRDFDIDLTGLSALDVGASTGGFTQVMLEAGAAMVYTVDTGKDQLHAMLREDSRVYMREGTDIRKLQYGDIPEVDFICIDVSFISLALVLPAAVSFLKPGGFMVCLCKPQFEVGREKVGRRGIVRDESARLYACEKVRTCADMCGLDRIDMIQSPIEGGDGNIEYLFCFKR